MRRSLGPKRLKGAAPGLDAHDVGFSRPLAPQANSAEKRDAAWNTLVANTKHLGLIEGGNTWFRWLKHSQDGRTVAQYSVSQSRLQIKLSDPDVHASALALDGVTKGTRGYIEVPLDHHREWAELIALDLGRPELANEPETRPAVGESAANESPSPEPEPGSPATMASELERLAELHARGSLTDEKFHLAKARVLGTE